MPAAVTAPGRVAGRLVVACAAVLLVAGCGGAARDGVGAGTASGGPGGTAAGAVVPTVPALGTAADDLPAARVVLVGDGGEVAVDVRVAATADARARGLMGVTALPEGAGMLFRFPEVAAHGGFWMRGTVVPLDIAFLAAGEVVAVATMTPCRADPCPVTRPDRPYDAALEVPAGWLDAVGIAPGARLRVVAE